MKALVVVALVSIAMMIANVIDPVIGMLVAGFAILCLVLG